MRKLNSVEYVHTSKLTEDAKDDLIIPEDFEGNVAIEVWNVNGEIKRRAVCFKKFTDYLLGLGSFQELTDGRNER